MDVRLVPIACAVWLGAWLGFHAHLGVAAACATLLVAIWRRTSRSVACALGFVVAFALAWGAVASVTQGPAARILASDEPIKGEAVVTSDIRVATHGAYVPIRFVVLESPNERWQGSVPGTLSLPAGSWPQVGELVDVVGKGRPPRPGDASAGSLTARRLDVATRPGFADRQANAFRERIRQAMSGSPDDQAALVPSLVVGDTSRLSSEMIDAFRATGLSHLLAVSGTNLTLMLVFGLAVARGVGVRGWWLRGLSVGIAAAFVLVCRHEPSVMRAAVMGVVATTTTGLGREPARALRNLSLAVIALVLADPWMARSWGFALSVTACAGLVWWGQRWAELIETWAPRWLAEAIAIPVAAQLATQPLVTALSGQLSLVGVVANIAAAPCVGPVTILGLVAGFVGIPGFARIVGWLAGWLCQPIILVARGCAGLPGATWTWPAHPMGLICLLACCLVGACIVMPRVLRSRTLSVGLAALLVVAMLRAPASPGWPGDWRVIACDVGQGSAILVRASEDSAILVDAGPDPGALRTCLAQARVSKLPLVVLTHMHADHVGGLPALDTDRVGIVLLGHPGDANSGHVTAVGEVFDVGEARWTTLQVGPEAVAAEGGDSSAENDAGIVGLVEAGGLSVLVTGDLEEEGQRRLLAAGVPHVDVFVTPHHGSSHHDAEFYAKVHAPIALIQVGEDNDYGHPAPSAIRSLQRAGSTIYRTDERGAIAVQQGGDRVVTQR